MANFPPDRYDEVPADLQRVGAHRSPRKRGRGAIAFAWAALATGLLVVAGLYGLSRVNPDISFQLPNFGGGENPAPSASPSASAVPPVTDPKEVPKKLPLTISVLNGSSVDGLEKTAGDAIKAAGWPDPVRSNADTRTIELTTVYYADARYEGIARGLAQLVGATRVFMYDRYGSPVTIVLGSDYAAANGGSGG